VKHFVDVLRVSVKDKEDAKDEHFMIRSLETTTPLNLMVVDVLKNYEVDSPLAKGI
jgi:hypothetical protein